MPPRLDRPESVGNEVVSSQLAGFLVIHLLALLALVPAFFSWTGVALVFLGNYVFGSLGINLGYHRLLTHRGFSCPKWLEYTLTLLGVCSLQDSPARWVATHRMHHRDSDEQPDPHSPLVNFLWGHIGWLIFKNRRIRHGAAETYAKDLLRDPFHARLNRNRLWLWIYLAHGVVLGAVGCLAGWFLTSTPSEAMRFGASVFVWGVLVRTVYVWHITWLVNSAAHLWGYQNYETGENSRNNWVVALLTNGEGWHNNHHAHQRSAAHGHRWWELDLTYATIRLMRALGLVWDVVLPPDAAAMPNPRHKRVHPASAGRGPHRAERAPEATVAPGLDQTAG